MKFRTQLLILLFFIMGSSTLMAQPGFDPDVDDVAPIPGIALAIAAGVFIGVRELRNKK